MPTPGTSDYDVQLSQETERIFGILGEMDFANVRVVLEELLDNEDIDNEYNAAMIAAENEFINRHDKLHAVKVVHNALRVYGMLKDIIELQGMTVASSAPAFQASRFIAQSGRVLDVPLARECSCGVVAVSSYLHDVCKYMKRHDEAAGYYIHEKLPEWLQPLEDPEVAQVKEYLATCLLPLIVTCIQKHTGVDEASNAEEGIVMLADSLDNDKERIRDIYPPEVVLSKDEKPIEYFSCAAVKKISLDSVGAGSDRRLSITFGITDNSGWYQVHQFKKAMEKSRLGRFVELSVSILWENRIVKITVQK